MVLKALDGIYVLSILAKPSMHIISFTYNSKEYIGYIASSTIKEPHFHWLFFTDEALTKMVGDDCIAFVEADGTLEHYNRVSLNHVALVNVAKKHIEDYLREQKDDKS